MDTWNKIACSDLGGLRAAYSWYRLVSDRPAWRRSVRLYVPSWDLISPRHMYDDDDECMHCPLHGVDP